MTSYADNLAAERRRAILALMVDGSDRANERVLFQALRALGLGTGLEQAGVRALLVWLEARACLTTEIVSDTIMVARITDRGRLVVDGALKLDGVAPPSAVI